MGQSAWLNNRVCHWQLDTTLQGRRNCVSMMAASRSGVEIQKGSDIMVPMGRRRVECKRNSPLQIVRAVVPRHVDRQQQGLGDSPRVGRQVAMGTSMNRINGIAVSCKGWMRWAGVCMSTSGQGSSSSVSSGREGQGKVSTNPGHKEYMGSAIPTPEEDREVAHEAFLHAFEASRPENCRVVGMQQFAAAILARAQIPSQQYSDPLKHVFEEFDRDGDGELTSSEVGDALRSRGVEITNEQVEMFIDATSLEHSDKVKQTEFRDLILHMAAADLHSRKLSHDGPWARCVLESDDEIREKLQVWRNTMQPRMNWSSNSEDE